VRSRKVALDGGYAVWVQEMVQSISLNSSPDDIKKWLCNPAAENVSISALGF